MRPLPAYEGVRERRQGRESIEAMKKGRAEIQRGIATCSELLRAQRERINSALAANDRVLKRLAAYRIILGLAFSLASVRQRASTRSDSADRVVGLSGGLACGCNHEAHPYNMSCFGTILISYEADGRNRCEGCGLSILTSFGENWLFDGWNVNEFK
jgi:hypothetical protein